MVQVAMRDSFEAESFYQRIYPSTFRLYIYGNSFGLRHSGVPGREVPPRDLRTPDSYIYLSSLKCFQVGATEH